MPTEYKPETASNASFRAKTLGSKDLLESLALNLQKSFFVRGVGYHATGLKLSNKTQAKSQGHASVEILLPPKSHDAVTRETLTSGQAPAVDELQR